MEMNRTIYRGSYVSGSLCQSYKARVVLFSRHASLTQDEFGVFTRARCRPNWPFAA
jgi:hypothetical protein